MIINMNSGPVDPAVLYTYAAMFGVRMQPLSAGRTPTERELDSLLGDLGDYLRREQEANGLAWVACDCGRRFPDLEQLTVCPYCGNAITDVDEPEPAAPTALAKRGPAPAAPAQDSAQDSAQAAILSRWDKLRQVAQFESMAFWLVGKGLIEIKAEGLYEHDPEFTGSYEKLIELRLGKRWSKAYAYQAMQVAASVPRAEVEANPEVGIAGWLAVAREVLNAPPAARARVAAEATAKVAKVSAAAGGRGKGKGKKRGADVKAAVAGTAVKHGGKVKKKAEPKRATPAQPAERLVDLPAARWNGHYELQYQDPKTGVALSRPRKLEGMKFELRAPGGKFSLVFTLGKTRVDCDVVRKK